MIEYIKKSHYLFDASARKSMPFLIIAFLFTSFLDVIGIGLIGVFLGILLNPHTMLHRFPDFILFKKFTEKELVSFFGLLILGAFFFKSVVNLYIQKHVVFFCQSLAIRLQSRLMKAYQYAPYIYHIHHNSAYLISRILTNASSCISGVILPTLNLISNLLMAIAIFLFLAILHPVITMILVVMFFLIIIMFDLFVKQKLYLMGKDVALAHGELIKNIHNGLKGLTEIRVLGREDSFIGNINKISRKYAYASGVLLALQQVPRYLIENMIAVFVVTISLVSVFAGFGGNSFVSVIAVFAAAGARLLPVFTQIMSSTNQIRGGVHNIDLVYDELFELEFKAYANEILSMPQEEKLSFSELVLKDVNFYYPDASYPSLVDINLKILRGQSIGLIGHSGAGKSTLVNLILKFLDLQQGELLVNGAPIDNVRKWLNNFAYIPQSIFLLDDTLRRNVALGVEDKDIDDKKVWDAICMAQLIDVVNELPNGLDTLIGENGVRLSGGQRQRVALARAFYHERDIIVMDEATSSLDNETEKEVINTIKRFKGNKTLIVIAHRLSTVEHCDVLYRLENGKITAVGSFQEVVGTVT